MYFDFSTRKAPSQENELTLDVIYYIDGDNTYSTPKKEITPGKTYFVYTLQGTGSISYDGQTYTVTGNTFMYMQPTKDFSYHCKGNKWTFWWFEFTGDCPFQPNKLTNLPVDKLMVTLMSNALLFAKTGDWDLSTSLFHSVNLLVKRNADRSSRDVMNEQIVYTMERYIRKNLATVTVHELSEEFGVEERTLRNLFTKTIGITPKQCILKIRLEYAGNLLLATEQPLSSISQSAGFANQYHFSKAFKEFYGITPMQYRKFIGLF